MTISHLGIWVDPSRMDAMIEWYLAALAPLGYKLVYDLRPAHQVVGLGTSKWQPDFWISTKADGHVSTDPGNKIHLAFAAKNRQQIRDFYDLAIKAGGKDNGPPGLRPHYMATYYAAYVFDPEGRNIEVHNMMPAILSEPTQWNLLVAGTFSALAVGVAYFANVGGYFSSLL